MRLQLMRPCLTVETLLSPGTMSHIFLEIPVGERKRYVRLILIE